MARSISDHNGESTVYDHNVDTGSEQVHGFTGRSSQSAFVDAQNLA
jgi:hypothetical protein